MSCDMTHLFYCPNTLQAVLPCTSHYATFYSLLPFAVSLVQHVPVPSVLKQPQSTIFLVSVFSDTINPYPALNVTNYVYKAHKQLVPTGKFYILILISRQDTER